MERQRSGSTSYKRTKAFSNNTEPLLSIFDYEAPVSQVVDNEEIVAAELITLKNNVGKVAVSNSDISTPIKETGKFSSKRIKPADLIVSKLKSNGIDPKTFKSITVSKEPVKTWEDDRACKDNEGLWKDLAYKYPAIITCASCKFVTECVANDFKDNLAPGIKFGLGHEKRKKYYQKYEGNPRPVAVILALLKSSNKI